MRAAMYATAGGTTVLTVVVSLGLVEAFIATSQPASSLSVLGVVFVIALAVLAGATTALAGLLAAAREVRA